jgi:hypothetical protein
LSHNWGGIDPDLFALISTCVVGVLGLGFCNEMKWSSILNTLLTSCRFSSNEILSDVLHEDLALLLLFRLASIRSVSSFHGPSKLRNTPGFLPLSTPPSNALLEVRAVLLDEN